MLVDAGISVVNPCIGHVLQAVADAEMPFDDNIDVQIGGELQGTTQILFLEFRIVVLLLTDVGGITTDTDFQHIEPLKIEPTADGPHESGIASGGQRSGIALSKGASSPLGPQFPAPGQVDGDKGLILVETHIIAAIADTGPGSGTAPVYVKSIAWKGTNRQ